MKETIKQVTELAVAHPKTSLVVTSLFTSHAWLDYGEPIIKALTSIFGLCVIIAILTKHILDIKKSIKESKGK